MAVMILIEEKKLDLDDPISKYLDVPNAWSAITVRHLLTHTSGLGVTPKKTLQERDPGDDKLDVIKAQPLTALTKVDCSNFGYVYSEFSCTK